MLVSQRIQTRAQIHQPNRKNTHTYRLLIVKDQSISTAPTVFRDALRFEKVRILQSPENPSTLSRNYF